MIVLERKKKCNKIKRTHWRRFLLVVVLGLVVVLLLLLLLLLGVLLFLFVSLLFLFSSYTSIVCNSVCWKRVKYQV